MIEGLKRAKEIIETEIQCELIEDNNSIEGLRTALFFINEEIKTEQSNED
ncbi:MAG TPA: hypothetical protein VIK72_19480 [Clostridiaceae bacterium]